MSDLQWNLSLVEAQGSSQEVAGWIEMNQFLGATQGKTIDEQTELLKDRAGINGLFLTFPKASSDEQWQQACAIALALKSSDIPLCIVLPKTRMMSEAASAIDSLAALGLPRGVPNLKVHLQVDCAASALTCQRLLSYFDGVVLDFAALTQSVFASHSTTQQMMDSKVIERLAFDVISLAVEAKKPCYSSSDTGVTASLSERLADHKISLAGVVVPAN